MDFDSTTIGVVIIAVVLGMDKVLSTLRSRGIDLHKISQQIAEMHDWHSQVDSDGVKVWYVRRSLEEAIEKLTKVLDSMDRRMERMEERLTKMGE